MTGDIQEKEKSVSLYADPTKRIYDAITLNLFQLCERKYYWNIVQNLVSVVPSPAQHFGKAIHSGIEEWYRSGKSLVKMLEAFRKGMEGLPEDSKRTLECGEALLGVYDRKYKEEEMFDVVENEITLSYPMKDGSTLIGRIDRLARMKESGLIVPIETKTTSFIGENFLYSFMMNTQIDVYVYLVNKHYGLCHEALIDSLQVLGATSVKPLAERLYRFSVQRSAEDMQEFEERYYKTVARMEAIKRDGKEDYLQTPSACTYYGKCPYLPLCLYRDERIIGNNYKPREVLEAGRGGEE